METDFETFAMRLLMFVLLLVFILPIFDIGKVLAKLQIEKKGGQKKSLRWGKVKVYVICLSYPVYYAIESMFTSDKTFHEIDVAAKISIACIIVLAGAILEFDSNRITNVH